MKARTFSGRGRASSEEEGAQHERYHHEACHGQHRFGPAPSEHVPLAPQARVAPPEGTFLSAVSGLDDVVLGSSGTCTLVD